MATADQVLALVASVSPAVRAGRVEQVRPEHSLGDDLGFDSLALVELAVQVEAEFALETVEPVDVRTAGDVVRLVAGSVGVAP